MHSVLPRIPTNTIEITNIIDIGASDGKWSTKAMPFFPESSFLAIEPLRERRDALEKLKKQYPTFDYVLCAAGEDTTKNVDIAITTDLDGSTIDGLNGTNRTVPIKSLDTIISEKHLSGPFLLKFDTHGYEIPILKSAKKTLQNTNIIIMEVYNFKISEHTLLFYEMCCHLDTLGFRCYDMADPMLRQHDNSFWQMDLFFCRKDMPLFQYNQYE